MRSSSHLLMQTPHGSSRLSLADGHFWQIGRGRDNAVPLFDHCASRHHALIRLLGQNSYYLFDQGSRNGTYVNGKRIQLPTLLAHGDIINIGETTLEFADRPNEEVSQNPVDQESPEQSVPPQPCLISALLVDIRNYSKLRQQVTERVLAEVTYQWFSRSIDIIHTKGSYVEQIIGSAIFAVKIHEMEPEAQQMTIDQMLPTFNVLRELHLISEEISQQFQLPLPLGISAGLNTNYAEVQGGYAQTLTDVTKETFALQSASQVIGLDVGISATTRQRTPYSILLPFKQYLVNLPDSEQPTLTYAGSFDGVSEFLDKVSVVFS